LRPPLPARPDGHHAVVTIVATLPISMAGWGHEVSLVTCSAWLELIAQQRCCYL